MPHIASSSNSMATNPDWTTAFAEDVVPHLAADRVLVSLVGIDGSSPRPLGAQMVVDPADTARTRHWGYLTGGCLEEAIVNEAIAAFKAQENRLVRYGAGSPYLDLVLPCGSGIDLYFDVSVPAETISMLLEARHRRQAVATRTNFAAQASARICEGLGPTTVENGCLVKRHDPPVRLVIAGAGPVALFLAQLARDTGLSVEVLTPDARTADHAKERAFEVRRLESPRDIIDLDADHRTAVVTLFHDHDWEPPVLKAALATSAFYVGAMGSRRTHAARLHILDAIGVSEDSHRRIKGPAGLAPGARSAPEIATSILAEVLSEARVT